MEENMHSIRINMKKKVLVLWGIVIAVFIVITVISIMKFSKYTEAQKFAVDSMLSISDEYDKYKGDYEKLVHSMYCTFHPNGIMGMDNSELYKAADKADESLGRVMREAGYECYKGSVYLRYTSLLDYSVAKMSSPYIISIGLIIVTLLFSVWVLVVSKKSIIVDTDRIICTKGKKIVKEFMIKDVKSAEVVALKGLCIRGNSIKYKIILLKNVNELREEIMKKISDFSAQISNENQSKIMPSTADELKKYKELLDMGAITQEEFELKKKEVLGI